jgi:hypothetical protein
MTVRESVALPEHLVRVLSGQARYAGCAALRQSLRPTLEQKHTLEDELVAIFGLRQTASKIA